VRSEQLSCTTPLLSSPLSSVAQDGAQQPVFDTEDLARVTGERVNRALRRTVDDEEDIADGVYDDFMEALLQPAASAPESGDPVALTFSTADLSSVMALQPELDAVTGAIVACSPESVSALDYDSTHGLTKARLLKEAADLKAFYVREISARKGETGFHANVKHLIPKTLLDKRLKEAQTFDVALGLFSLDYLADIHAAAVYPAKGG